MDLRIVNSTRVETEHLLWFAAGGWILPEQERPFGFFARVQQIMLVRAPCQRIARLTAKFANTPGRSSGGGHHLERRRLHFWVIDFVSELSTVRRNCD